MLHVSVREGQYLNRKQLTFVLCCEVKLSFLLHSYYTHFSFTMQ